MEEWAVSVNDLKHFAYCEAILLLTHRLGFRETETEYMMYGKEVEKEEFLRQIVHKYKVKKIHRQPALVSRELRLSGVPDAVLETASGELIPLEVKWSEPPPSSKVKRDHFIQLSAYAVLIERTWLERKASVKRGIVYYLRPTPRFFEVRISAEDKAAVLRLLERAILVATGKAEPRPRRTCRDCNYRSFCPFASD
ncbi:MAG: CRISPR-associated protein Cas4 [Infirmifilum sp.]